MIVVTFVITALLLIAALWVKRYTMTTRDALAFGLVAILLFLVLSGALNALHLPALSLSLPGTR